MNLHLKFRVANRHSVAGAGLGSGAPGRPLATRPQLATFRRKGKLALGILTLVVTAAICVRAETNGAPTAGQLRLQLERLGTLNRVVNAAKSESFDGCHSRPSSSRPNRHAP